MGRHFQTAPGIDTEEKAATRYTFINIKLAHMPLKAVGSFTIDIQPGASGNQYVGVSF
jgi:hypothetical protein